MPDELTPLSDAEKLQMLEHLGVRFVPYKDSSGPARWVVEHKEGSLLHKFDAQRLELLSEAICVQTGHPEQARYVHLKVPSQAVDALGEPGIELLIQVKLDDEGVAIDLYDHEARSVASGWRDYHDMGVEVKDVKECP